MWGGGVILIRGGDSNIRNSIKVAGFQLGDSLNFQT